MGRFRKTTSVLTLGAVDLRSDKERIAMYTWQTRNAVRSADGSVYDWDRWSRSWQPCPHS